MKRNHTNILEILTDSEIDIAREVAMGFSEKEIADRKCVSVNTVHTHTYNIRKKTFSRSAVDIARKYILSLDEPKKHFLGAIAIASSILFNLTIQQPKLELMETITMERFTANDFTRLVETMEHKNLSSGTYEELEIRTDGYLVIVNCEVSKYPSYERSATYLQPEEFEIESEVEITKLEVTDMYYNDIEVSMYQREKLIQAVSNHLIIE